MSQSERSTNSKNNNKDWGLVLLVLSATMLAAAFFLDDKSNTTELPSINHPKIEIEMSAKLKDSAWKEEIKKNSVSNENEVAPPIAESQEYSDDSKKVLPLTFEQDPHTRDVMREIEERGKKNSVLTPDERISLKLQLNRWLDDYKQRQNDEYIRQFLQNARAKGIEIQLNEDLDVVGIEQHPAAEPIRIPQSLPQNPK